MPLPTEDEIERMHRYFAVECNNQAWDLADLDNRTDAQTEEMTRCAKAAAWHWSKVGKPINHARANMLLGWVCCNVGWAGDARTYTDRVSAQLQAEPEGVSAWDEALLTLLEARTCLAEGNQEEYDAASAKLDLARAKLNDEEEQAVFDRYRAGLTA